MTVSPEEIRAHLAVVHERLAAIGRDPASVRIIAVTKGHPVEVVEAARAAGFVDIGENYAQELVDKVEHLRPGPMVRWHAIGRMQTNKVRAIAPLVHLWQTVDREHLATEIARRAPGARVLVQVNVSDEPQKGGCPPAEAAGLVARCRELGLDVQGLMTVGRTGPPAEARSGFALLRRLGDELGLAELSMGMSGDYAEAAAEGATMLRLGTILFGARPPAPS
jgi:pyridoxal phosphate enzyme (YggS family)